MSLLSAGETVDGMRVATPHPSEAGRDAGGDPAPVGRDASGDPAPVEDAGRDASGDLALGPVEDAGESWFSGVVGERADESGGLLQEDESMDADDPIILSDEDVEDPDDGDGWAIAQSQALVGTGETVEETPDNLGRWLLRKWCRGKLSAAEVREGSLSGHRSGARDPLLDRMRQLNEHNAHRDLKRFVARGRSMPRIY